MPAHFGLDIGTSSIKVVFLEKKGKTYKLKALGETKTPVSLSSYAETDKRAIAQAIRKLVLETKIPVKEVNLSLSETMAYSQVIELPYLSDPELAAAIKYEAEQYVPDPINEVKLEYLVLSTTLGELKDKRMQVLLVAAKNFAVNQMVEIVELSGLFPVSMETEVLSLCRAVNFNHPENYLLLDLGFSSTKIIILAQQNIKLIRTMNTGGEALTRAIVRELNMEPLQAEQYKITYGFNESALEGKIAKAMIPIFNVVMLEIKKALNFFNQKEPKLNIKGILLAGAGANMIGLNYYLAQGLGLEVQVFDPFSKIIVDQELNKVPQKNKYSISLGLALRED